MLVFAQKMKFSMKDFVSKYLNKLTFTKEILNKNFNICVLSEGRGLSLIRVCSCKFVCSAYYRYKEMEYRNEGPWLVAHIKMIACKTKCLFN